MFEGEEAPAQKLPKPLFVGFGMGLLVGGAIVTAGVVGVMIGRSGRPVIPEKAALSAEQPASIAGTLNSESDETPVRNDVQDDETASQNDQTELPGGNLMSKGANVHENPAAVPLPASKPSRSKPEAAELARIYETNDESRQDSEQKIKVARPTMALLAPHPASSPSGLETQKAIADENVPPGVMSTTQLATATSNILALPGPAQPASEPSNRNTSYSEATLIQRSEPFYPTELRKKHVGGLVKFNATIGTDGVARGLQLISGDSRLAQAAQKAISRWRYIPAVSGGSPVESHIVIVLNFQP
jgi:outer membrane biosynthesis protein TonB